MNRERLVDIKPDIDGQDGMTCEWLEYIWEDIADGLV